MGPNVTIHTIPAKNTDDQSTQEGKICQHLSKAERKLLSQGRTYYKFPEDSLMRPEHFLEEEEELLIATIVNSCAGLICNRFLPASMILIHTATYKLTFCLWAAAMNATNSV